MTFSSLKNLAPVVCFASSIGLSMLHPSPVFASASALETTSSIGVTTQESPEAFIKELGNDVISILQSKQDPLSTRKKKFRQEVREHFDLPAIGKFIMARYWRRMDDTQKQAYIRLFEDAVVENYASQFDNYKNEKLVILDANSTKDGGTVVSSQIQRPGQKNPLNIKWKVFNTKRGLKVLDVVINNVSMSLTLRGEYSSVISSRGGVPGLLSYLEEKIQKDQAKHN